MLEAKSASNAELIRFLDEEEKAPTAKAEPAATVVAPKVDVVDKAAPAAPVKDEAK
jgi:hypothetical protein